LAAIYLEVISNLLCCHTLALSIVNFLHPAQDVLVVHSLLTLVRFGLALWLWDCRRWKRRWRSTYGLWIFSEELLDIYPGRWRKTTKVVLSCLLVWTWTSSIELESFQLAGYWLLMIYMNGVGL
jgi:hypothetical protein